MEYYRGKQQSESFELRWKATEEEVEKRGEGRQYSNRLLSLQVSTMNCLIK